MSGCFSRKSINVSGKNRCFRKQSSKSMLHFFSSEFFLGKGGLDSAFDNGDSLWRDFTKTKSVSRVCL